MADLSSGAPGVFVDDGLGDSSYDGWFDTRR
jgi:hypothetical protein